MADGLSAGVGPASYLEIAWTLCALVALVALIVTTRSARKSLGAIQHWTQARAIHIDYAKGSLRRRYERCYFAAAYLALGINAMTLPPALGAVMDVRREATQIGIALVLILANVILARGAVLDLLEDRRVMDALFSGELTGG